MFGWIGGVVGAVAAWVGGTVTGIIASLGYLGVVLLMAIESCGVPLPSEVVLPFGGAQAEAGRLSVWLVAVAGAVGCVVGSAAAYLIGAHGGREFLEKHGRWALITRSDLDRADRWFERHGGASVFWARLLPVVRTYISFPAGIARMRWTPFLLYTFVGSLIWSAGLAWAGFTLGENWEAVKPYAHRVEIGVAALLVVGVVWWVVKHRRRR